MTKFENALKETLADEAVLSENGAVMFKTSGKKLVDLNFSVSSLRNAPAADITGKFSDAFYECPLLAVKWLFFARDVRGGMGERRLFRICFSWLANIKPELVKKLIPLVAEYGRLDDILTCGLEGELWDKVVDYVAEQLKLDIEACDAGKSISLLAKWMPSANTSSPKTRALAKKLRQSLGMDEKTYRQTLAKLRARLNVVEVIASSNEWGKIDYNAVPSQANIKYRGAFLKHDEERRRAYLEALTKPESGAKINAAAAFPCDIVSKYSSCYAVDNALEAMWKALPDFVAGNDAGKTLVIADGSASMTTHVSGKMTALDVANSLAIYFSEKLTGPFKNKYVTFSMKPQFVDFSNAGTLKEKIAIALQHDECANTNIEAVFDLILDTAVRNKLTQDELPANVLVVSDMEFDGCACGNESIICNDSWWGMRANFHAADNALFTKIAQRYEAAGYTLPRLVFWNVASRTGGIPIKSNSFGVALVSGYSPAIAKMVFSAKTSPFDALVDVLSAKRYMPIENACYAAGFGITADECKV